LPAGPLLPTLGPGVGDSTGGGNSEEFGRPSWRAGGGGCAGGGAGDCRRGGLWGGGPGDGDLWRRRGGVGRGGRREGGKPPRSGGRAAPWGVGSRGWLRAGAGSGWVVLAGGFWVFPVRGGETARGPRRSLHLVGWCGGSISRVGGEGGGGGGGGSAVPGTKDWGGGTGGKGAATVWWEGGGGGGGWWGVGGWGASSLVNDRRRVAYFPRAFAPKISICEFPQSMKDSAAQMDQGASARPRCCVRAPGLRKLDWASADPGAGGSELQNPYVRRP